MSFTGKVSAGVLVIVLTGLGFGFLIGKFALEPSTNIVAETPPPISTPVTPSTESEKPVKVNFLSGVGGEKLQFSEDQSTPMSTIKSYFSYYFSRNYEEAYALWDDDNPNKYSKSFKDTLKEEILSNNVFKNGDAYSVEIHPAATSGESEKAVVKLVLNGQTALSDVIVTKKDGKYYITGIVAHNS